MPRGIYETSPSSIARKRLPVKRGRTACRELVESGPTRTVDDRVPSPRPVRYNGRVQSRIPLAHRLRLLGVYARLVLVYNVAIAALGATALLLLRRADLVEGVVSARVGLEIAGLIVATAGHWLAVLVFGLVHHREYALFRSGGWGPNGLRTVSWAIAVVAGVAVFAAARM